METYNYTILKISLLCETSDTPGHKMCQVHKHTVVGITLYALHKSGLCSAIMEYNIYSLEFQWQNKAPLFTLPQKEYEIIISLLFITSAHFLSNYKIRVFILNKSVLLL